MMAAASRSRSERSLDLLCASSAWLNKSAASASNSSTASSSAVASKVWNKAARVAVAPWLLEGCQVGRLGRARVARQPAQRSGGQVGGWRQAQAVATDGVDALQVPEQLGRGAPLRRGPEVVQRGERLIVGGDQRHQLLALPGGQGLGSGVATAAGWRTRLIKRSSVDTPGSSTLCAKSQVVARSNSRPGRSSPVPAQDVKPPGQPEAGAGVLLQVAEPVLRADGRGVPPSAGGRRGQRPGRVVPRQAGAPWPRSPRAAFASGRQGRRPGSGPSQAGPRSPGGCARRASCPRVRGRRHRGGNDGRAAPRWGRRRSCHAERAVRRTGNGLAWRAELRTCASVRARTKDQALTCCKCPMRNS